MQVIFRDANLSDYPAVLELNHASVHYLSPLDDERLTYLADLSCQFRVAELNGEVVGFLMALTDGSDYDSVNYRWFDTRYRQFVYVDRIVVRDDCRGLGLARQFYQELEAWATHRAVGWLTCEVDIEPPNTGSLHFHDKAGFTEVGQQAIGDGSKVVSLRAKPLA